MTTHAMTSMTAALLIALGMMGLTSCNGGTDPTPPPSFEGTWVVGTPENLDEARLVNCWGSQTGAEPQVARDVLTVHDVEPLPMRLVDPMEHEFWSAWVAYRDPDDTTGEAFAEVYVDDAAHTSQIRVGWLTFREPDRFYYPTEEFYRFTGRLVSDGRTAWVDVDLRGFVGVIGETYQAYYGCDVSPPLRITLTKMP